MVEPSRRAPPPGVRSARFGLLQVAIVALTLATALVHLYLAFVVMPPVNGGHVDIAFLLNGLGYLGLLAALYLPLPLLARTRTLARWALVGYTALTVLLWIIITQFLGTEATPLGYIDKALEFVLIVLLVVESQQQGVA